MGTSNWQNISYCIGVIRTINPQKVLDIGVGFGRWGYLSREVLDVWNGNVHSDKWLIQIDGVEIFETNIEDHQKHIYSNIYVEDGFDYIQRFDGRYDLIILGDVLEHFNKDRAFELLKNCRQKSEYILINLPVGRNWKQCELYGNEYERHLSSWSIKDFADQSVISKKIFFDYIGRKFIVLVLSDTNKHFKLKSVLHRVKDLLFRYPRIRSFLSRLNKYFH